MVVYVGNSPDGPAAAAVYDPRRNAWKRLPAGPLGVREQYASVWTGKEIGLAVVNGAVWNGHEAFVAGQLYRASDRFSGPILFRFDPRSNKPRRIDLSRAPLSAFERMWLRPVGRSGSEIVFAAGRPSSSVVIVRPLAVPG